MRIQLFPLHTVLAPGIALPLHVFEDRYRRMVRRCLDASEPFGIVLINRGSEVITDAGAASTLALADVGTFAEIREASLRPDGRWDLLVVGSGRFRVQRLALDASLALEADVEPVPDEPGDPATATALTARVTKRFVDYLRLLQPKDGEVVAPIDVQVEVDVLDTDEDDDEDEEVADDVADDVDGDPDEAIIEGGGPSELLEVLRIPDDPSVLSFLLTGIIQVEPARKQALLEAASAEDRLRDLDGLLDREIGLLRQRLAFYVPERGTLGLSEN
jgi:Lon protease-like protein